MLQQVATACCERLVAPGMLRCAPPTLYHIIEGKAMDSGQKQRLGREGRRGSSASQVQQLCNCAQLAKHHGRAFLGRMDQLATSF